MSATERDGATGFSPDWDAIYDAWLGAPDVEYEQTYALPEVIADYERQAAAAGWVMVRQNNLLNAFTLIEEALSTIQIESEARRLLEMAQELIRDAERAAS